MSLLQKIKEKFSSSKKVNTLSEPMYMMDGSAFVCQDKNNNVLKSTKIVAEHTNESEIDFPRFIVTKTSFRDGMIGMYHKTSMVLDTDDEPTEGSKNLLTSGDIYKVVSDLQDQIEDLRFLIKQ